MSTKIYFANFVNELMTEIPGPNHAKALTTVSPRKIWLAQPGDLIVSPRAIGAIFKRYACDILGISENEIHVIVPDNKEQRVLSHLIGHGVSRKRLEDYVSSKKQLTVQLFAQDRPSIELFRQLNVAIEGYSGYPDNDTIDVIYKANTKSGIRQIGQDLGFRTIPGCTVESREALTATVAKMIAEHGAVVVKLDRGSNGYGNFVVSVDDVRNGALEEHLSTISEQPEKFTIEKFMPFVALPSVELHCSQSGGKITYLCDMRCTNNAWSGMITPPVKISAEQEETLRQWGKTFANWAYSHGYRGHCDLDCGITDEGSVYLMESNFRRTGGTYLDMLVRRLIGENYLESHYWLADTKLGTNDLSFAEGIEAAEDAGIGWDKEKKEGVIFTLDSRELDRKWRYLILARSAEQVGAIESKLIDILKM